MSTPGDLWRKRHETKMLRSNFEQLSSREAAWLAAAKKISTKCTDPVRLRQIVPELIDKAYTNGVRDAELRAQPEDVEAWKTLLAKAESDASSAWMAAGVFAVAGVGAWALLLFG